MNNRSFNFRDISTPVYLQIKALSNIHDCLNNNLDINYAIDSLINEFKSYNDEINIKFINDMIFNTSTCFYALYFFVCCTFENKWIDKYNLVQDTLGNIIGTNHTVNMYDFSKFLRNAIAHIGFSFSSDGNIEIYNNQKVDTDNKIVIDNLNNQNDSIINFLKQKKLKDIRIDINKDGKYELIEQKYQKETFSLTHKQFLSITQYYTFKFAKTIMNKTAK